MQATDRIFMMGAQNIMVRLISYLFLPLGAGHFVTFLPAVSERRSLWQWHFARSGVRSALFRELRFHGPGVADAQEPLKTMPLVEPGDRVAVLYAQAQDAEALGPCSFQECLQ
jgi:hypothetical protein